MKKYPSKWVVTEIGVTEFHEYLKRALHEVLSNPDGVLADSHMSNKTVRHYLEQVALFYGRPEINPHGVVGDSTLDALVANLRDAVFNFRNEGNWPDDG